MGRRESVLLAALWAALWTSWHFHHRLALQDDGGSDIAVALESGPLPALA